MNIAAACSRKSCRPWRRTRLEAGCFSLRDRLLLVVVPFAMLIVGPVLAQQNAPNSNSDIAHILDDLPKAVVAGSPISQFFSSGARRRQPASIDKLQKQPFLKFEFVDYSLKELDIADGTHATLPVTVRWSTRSSEASKATTLHFVKESGNWYLDDVNFWDVSFLPFIPLLVLGLLYGAGFLVMYLHANRQPWQNPARKKFWEVLAVIPLAPFFYFAKQPWRHA